MILNKICLCPLLCSGWFSSISGSSDECMNLYKVGEVSADKLLQRTNFRNSCTTFQIFLAGLMTSWVGFFLALWLLVADLQWIPFVRLMFYLDKLNWITAMCFTALLNITTTIWIYAIIYISWRYAIGIPLIVVAIISTWLTFGSVWNLIIR